MNGLKKGRLSEAYGLLLILAASLAFKAFLLPFETIVTPDEGCYLRMGQYLSEGGRYNQFDFVPDKHKGQPFVPYLFSILPLKGDPVQAGRWASIVASLLALLIFHACARTFCSPREALFSDFILAFAPFHIESSLWAMTHSFYMLFLAAALYFSFRIQAGKWQSNFLAGAMFWAAYMTRVEAFAFVLAFILFIPWVRNFSEGENRFSVVKSSFQILTVFLILCLPVWIWIHHDTGTWQLTWTRGIGARGVFEWRWAIRMSGPLTAGNLLWHYLKCLKNVFSLLPAILPLPVWILSALGIVEILRRDSKSAFLFWCVSFWVFFPLFFYPALLAAEPRFFFPALMFVILPAGAGIRPLGEALVILLKCMIGDRIFLMLPALRILFFPVFLLVFLPGYTFLTGEYKEDVLEQKKAGQWLAENQKDSFILLGTDQRACFYAGKNCIKFVPMDDAFNAWKSEGISLESFLNRFKISVIAFDLRYGRRLYPEFEEWLKALPPPKLKEEWRTEYREKWVTLYRWDFDKAEKV